MSDTYGIPSNLLMHFRCSGIYRQKFPLQCPHHGPWVDLWYDLFCWSSSAIRIGIASEVPRQPLVMNINDPSTLTASYEASTVPLSDFSQLSELIGDSELSWATAPTVCIPNRAPETRKSGGAIC